MVAPVNIVALGDSVTQGAMEHRMLNGGAVYHRLLQQGLEDFFPTTTFNTINVGVSGGSAADGVVRLERDVLKHEPDLVLVAFGLNDSLGGVAGLISFESALRTIVLQVKSKTSADVILLTPSFMAQHKRDCRIHPDHEEAVDLIVGSQVSGTLADFAETIRKVARELRVCLADIHREWTRLAEDGLDTDDWLINGLNHPDRRGHKLAATVILTEILRQQYLD